MGKRDECNATHESGDRSARSLVSCSAVGAVLCSVLSLGSMALRVLEFGRHGGLVLAC